MELYRVNGSNEGGVLLTSYDEEVGANFTVTNANFTDFNQYSKNKSAAFTWSTKNIEIFINE